VPLFTTDSDAPASDRIAYLGSSNTAAGRQVGEIAVKALQAAGKLGEITVIAFDEDLSQLALARRLPSGLNATDKTESAWPRRISGSACGGSSDHTRTVLSSLALARCAPSGLNATELTEASWPRIISG
jgi:hypothetical protein